MENSKKQRSVRNILINPGFQGRMALFIVLAGFISTALNGYLYYDYVVDSYDFILKYSKLSQELIDGRYQDLRNFGLVLAIATLLITLAIAVWALFVSHRAAGAVYHMKRVIDEIKAGNVAQRVHLRDKDEFQDLGRSFNELMDHLQKSKTGT
jgi:nitrogen fixation/metabolism regulation signal transduction histidine kinase